MKQEVYVYVCGWQKTGNTARGSGIHENRLKGFIQLSSHGRQSLLSDSRAIQKGGLHQPPPPPLNLLSTASVCEQHLGSTTVTIDLIKLGRGLLMKCCSLTVSMCVGLLCFTLSTLKNVIAFSMDFLSGYCDVVCQYCRPFT